MTRALILDLDDTLYPERRFALSGYAEVARAVERRHGYPACDAFRVLRDALAHGRRAEAFQTLAHAIGIDISYVDTFREIYRNHQPRLRLPRASRDVLALVRRSWRVALLTNGLPPVQRAKVAALGLTSLVDEVVYAHHVGAGKPDAAVFLAACSALGVLPARAVMAGDDPWCDVDGARRAGLRTIRVRQGLHRDVESGQTGPADATVPTIEDVPAAAAKLIYESDDDAD
jgi:HAD superfamily hydrolase (TIGR01509 family)